MHPALNVSRAPSSAGKLREGTFKPSLEAERMLVEKLC